jgi:non-homologous end joining protein Ku
MKLVEKKIESGQTEAIDVEEAEGEPIPSTINFMDVLKKSVEHASKGRTKSARGTKAKPSPRGRRPRKKRAG